MSLKMDNNFKSYSDFEIVLNKYCSDQYVNFFVADSKANKDHNEIWNFIQYKCVHAQDTNTSSSSSSF